MTRDSSSAPTPPRRLSIDTKSPHFDECYRRVDVYLNGAKRPNDVAEYSVQDGWIETLSGRILHGTVEPRWRPIPAAPPPPDPAAAAASAAARQEAAEAKRARKAEKLLKRNEK